MATGAAEPRHLGLRDAVGGFLRALRVALLLIAVASPAVSGQGPPPDLCIVPVAGPVRRAPVNEREARNFSAELVAYDHRFGQTGTARPSPQTVGSPLLPGLPQPIFLSSMSPDAYTITRGNRFEPFAGDFPRSGLWDQFVFETTSGRVLGSNSHLGAIFAYDPGPGQFRPVAHAPMWASMPFGYVPSATDFRFIKTIAHIPRLGITLVGTEKGVFELRGTAFHPLPGATADRIGSVATIVDLPVHKGVMFAGDLHNAWIRHDNGSLDVLAVTVGLFGRTSQISGAIESRQPGRIVLIGTWHLIEVAMRPTPFGFSPGTAWRIAKGPPNRVNLLVSHSGELLLLGRPGWMSPNGLERLQPNGLRAVPGDAVPDWGLESWNGPSIRSIGIHNLVLIDVHDRWYAYDGNRVSLIPGTKIDQIGKYRTPVGLKTIGKAILQAERGLFELREDGTLEAIPLPFPYDYWRVSLSELPAAQVGLIATEDNLYTITRSGAIQPIAGGRADRYFGQAFVGVIPQRNAMIVAGFTRYWLIFDRATAGAECDNEVRGIVP